MEWIRKWNINLKIWSKSKRDNKIISFQLIVSNYSCPTIRVFSNLFWFDDLFTYMWSKWPLMGSVILIFLVTSATCYYWLTSENLVYTISDRKEFVFVIMLTLNTVPPPLKLCTCCMSKDNLGWGTVFDFACMDNNLFKISKIPHNLNLIIF